MVEPFLALFVLELVLVIWWGAHVGTWANRRFYTVLGWIGANLIIMVSLATKIVNGGQPR